MLTNMRTVLALVLAAALICNGVLARRIPKDCISGMSIIDPVQLMEWPRDAPPPDSSKWAIPLLPKLPEGMVYVEQVEYYFNATAAVQFCQVGLLLLITLT